MKLTRRNIEAEITKRETSEHREVNITDVSRVLRHLFGILGDEPSRATALIWVCDEIDKTKSRYKSRTRSKK